MNNQGAKNFKVNIPIDALGLPGAAYQLHTRGAKKGEPRQVPSHLLQDNYRVVLTLNRTEPEFRTLSFEANLTGDSNIHFAKAATERAAGDCDQMAISFGHGNQTLEITGTANTHGRLSKLLIETPAPGFLEAEALAFGAASPFLSAMAFDLDVPVRLGQIDVTQMSTGNTSMTYNCPYSDMVPAGNEFNNAPYIQSLMSLYREGINSNSPNYQFLCWYKIVEGINVRRAEETKVSKAPLPMKLSERLEQTRVQQRERLAEAFPMIQLVGASDSRWDEVVPEEVLNWKFNRVREQKLEPVRNRIAHMISEPSGDLSLSPDSRENIREVTKWLSLLRFISRVMILNEKVRIPT